MPNITPRLVFPDATIHLLLCSLGKTWLERVQISGKINASIKNIAGIRFSRATCLWARLSHYDELSAACLCVLVTRSHKFQVEEVLGFGSIRFFFFKRSCSTVIRRNTKNPNKGIEDRIPTDFLPVQGLDVQVGVEMEKNSLVNERIFFWIQSFLPGESDNSLELIRRVKSGLVIIAAVNTGRPWRWRSDDACGSQISFPARSLRELPLAVAWGVQGPYVNIIQH